MRKQVEAEYWICIIGATNSKNLKDGSDSPMRNAVKKAFEETTGHEDETCWSGWGSEKEKVDIVNAVWSMDKDNPLYEAIKCILKSGNKRDFIVGDVVCTQDGRMWVINELDGDDLLVDGNGKRNYPLEKCDVYHAH